MSDGLIGSLFTPRPSAQRYRDGGSSSSGFFSLFGGGKTPAGISVTHNSALGLTAFYSAVSLIADTLAMLPLQVLENDNGKRGRPSDHPVAYLLNVMANPEQTAFIVRQRHFIHACTWGNGYLEAVHDGGAEVKEIWNLLPDRTRPERANGGELRYRTSIDGQEFVLPRSDVLHIKAFGDDAAIGRSPVMQHRDALGLAQATQDYGAKFFANDAKSGGFLTHPGKLSDPARQNIKESANSEKGLENAHRIRLLEEGMKFVSTSIPPEDAQFLGTREFQIEEIARIFRVPPVLLQSLSKTTSWGSGIEQMMIHFITFTLGAWVKQYEQLLTSQLLKPSEQARGMYIKLNVNALLRGDMAARKEFYKAGITDGWMSREEVRELEDMPWEPGLDKFLLPLNMTEGDDNAV